MLANLLRREPEAKFELMRLESRRHSTLREQSGRRVRNRGCASDVANNWSIIPSRLAKSWLVEDKTLSSGRYRAQCSRVQRIPALPPVGPPPGGSADNFSLSGIQLDVAGTCSLLIKLRVAAPLPQNSRRVTRPITAACGCLARALTHFPRRVFPPVASRTPDTFHRAVANNAPV